MRHEGRAWKPARHGPKSAAFVYASPRSAHLGRPGRLKSTRRFDAVDCKKKPKTVQNNKQQHVHSRRWQMETGNTKHTRRLRWWFCRRCGLLFTAPKALIRTLQVSG